MYACFPGSWEGGLGARVMPWWLGLGLCLLFVSTKKKNSMIARGSEENSETAEIKSRLDL